MDEGELSVVQVADPPERRPAEAVRGAYGQHAFGDAGNDHPRLHVTFERRRERAVLVERTAASNAKRPRPTSTSPCTMSGASHSRSRPTGIRSPISPPGRSASSAVSSRRRTPRARTSNARRASRTRARPTGRRRVSRATLARPGQRNLVVAHHDDAVDTGDADQVRPVPPDLSTSRELEPHEARKAVVAAAKSRCHALTATAA